MGSGSTPLSSHAAFATASMLERLRVKSWISLRELTASMSPPQVRVVSEQAGGGP